MQQSDNTRDRINADRQKTIKAFKTIDQCVDFLISIGCTWNYENESKLRKDSVYVYGRYAVFYDPYDLLA